MKIKSIFIGLGFLFIFGGIAFSQSVNDVELTTYYPAPYGDYDMLSLTPSNGPPTATASDGMIYFDDGTTNAKGLYVYDGAWNQPGVPSGVIVMWSGNGGNIPAGWQLCNGVGTLSDGTPIPDLRERFVVGSAGDNPTVNGPAYASHTTGSHNENTVQLTTQQMPSHTHSASGSNTGAAGGHSHTVTDRTPENGGGGASPAAYKSGSPGWQIKTVNRTTSSRSDHTHSLSGMTIASSGGGQAHENRPPYYALCFIIKT